MPEYEVIDKAVTERAITDFDRIQAAIIEKGVSIPAGTPTSQYGDKIRAIEGGGIIPVRKAVNFLDYDGTLIAGFTVPEAQALTALPTPPVHDRLVFQGWNWTLADINALTIPMNIGAMYVTASGKSEFDITLTTVTTTAVTVRIYNESGTLTVDWGDGIVDYASSSAGTKTPSHIYAANGNYTINVDSTGTYYLYGTSTETNNIFNVSPSYICTAARLGARCTRISDRAFQSCQSLASATIPNSVTSIGGQAFHSCQSLTSVIIPNSVSTTTSITNILQSCSRLNSVAMPNSVISITTSWFNACYTLTNTTIPQSVTSIGNYAFASCYNQTSVTIPNSVTSIGSYAFNGCTGIISYFLLPTTPPILTNANAFTSINGICIMWAPPGSGAAYRAATNWATYANHIYEMTAAQYAELTGGA